MEYIKKAAAQLETNHINLFGKDTYIVFDTAYKSAALTTLESGDRLGQNRKERFFEAFNFSLPLQRIIGKTSSAMGIQHWQENGLNISWYYHPQNGLVLSVIGKEK